MVLFVGVLLMHSLFGTNFTGLSVNGEGVPYEHHMSIPDSPLRHMAVFAAVVVLMVVLRRAGQYLGKRFSGINAVRMMRICCLILAIMGVLFVAVTQLSPISDQRKISAIVTQWRESDFSGFEKENYLFFYPFQAGIILFYYLLSFVFGIDNYVGYQLCNIPAIVLIYYLLSKSAGLYWQEEKKEPVIYTVLMFCTPFFFYVTYIYGILPGMACALSAVYFTVRYFTKEGRQWKYVVGASLCIGIATVLKGNFLIYAVAIGCFLFYDILNVDWKEWKRKQLWKKQIKSLLFVMVMLVSIKGFNGAANSYVEHLSGHKLPEGEVMWSVVVMGLQEGPIGAGGYNGYTNNVYRNNGYDKELTTQATFSDLKLIVKRMLKEPGSAALFFARKNAEQWNDPTFLGMDKNDYRESAVNMPFMIQSIINGKGEVYLSVYFNFMQTLIWLGVLFYLFSRWGSGNIYELFCGVIFIGGFLFHLFWEGNSSYTLPYFVLVTPYAVKGWLDLTRGIDDGLKSMTAEYKKSGSLKQTVKQAAARIAAWSRMRRCVAGAAAAGILLLLVFMQTSAYDKVMAALDDGEAAAGQYYHLEAQESR